MENEKERISKMLERLSSESIDAHSEKLPEIVREHGFEHIRTEESGSFIVRDKETQKYFRIHGNRKFEEIESP